MPKVRILYVITKLELGGAQKQLLTLINHLDQEKFLPFLFTAKNGLLLKEALSINGLTVKESKCLERPISFFKDILALIEIHLFIKKNKIDIVHTHSSKAGILGRIAAKTANVKIILHTVHGWSFNDHHPGLIKMFFIYLEKFCGSFTDKIIVVSEHDKRKGLANHISKENRYSLVRYGIDYKEFQDSKGADLRKEFGVDATDLVVGMIACLKPQKYPQGFIKIASLIHQAMPEVKFILVGDGILRKEIEKLIHNLSLENNIILTGWRRDIPQILSIMDVFLLTSLWEGLPITVLEAIAAAKPVVATQTGGISEVIQEGKTGFLTACGDLEGLAGKTIILLKDTSLRKRISRNTKDALGADFRFENMVNYTQNLYSTLLQGNIPCYAN